MRLLGLLRAQQAIRIQEFNVSSLRNILDQFIEFHKAERLDSLQLSQTEGTLYQSESRLLSLRVDYETQLDQFKRDLGLPPDLPVEIQDPLLKQFELIDDENNAATVSNRRTQSRRRQHVLLDASAFIEANRFPIEHATGCRRPRSCRRRSSRRQVDVIEEFGIAWTEELKQKIAAIIPLLEKINPSIQEISVSDMGRIQADIEYLRQVRPRRTEALAELARTRRIRHRDPIRHRNRDPGRCLARGPGSPVGRNRSSGRQAGQTQVRDRTTPGDR